MKNLNSIIDTESKNVCIIGSNKYIITKIECWPLFKQDPFLFLILKFFKYNFLRNKVPQKKKKKKKILKKKKIKKWQPKKR